MLSAILPVWPLFLGMTLIMLGNGLQGSLLGIRALQEGFSTTATGVVMAGYFAGFLFGCLIVPRLVKNVGHVRVFAALASLASTAVLVHVLWINVPVWMLMRLLTGFCYAGLYVVAESWINDRSTNETRGQVFAFYMILVLGGMGSGQFLLNLGDTWGFELFVVSSVLISLALVPILLAAGQAPAVENNAKVSLREIYRLSPLGVISAIGCGLAHGTLMSLAAVYGGRIGLSTQGISFLVAMSFIGGLLFQWPLARLSDRYDRRRVLTAVSLAAMCVAVFGFFFAETSEWLLYMSLGLFGGLSLPLYSITAAHANDYLSPEQRIGGASALYVYLGVAATLGPILAAFTMDVAAPSAFFAFLAVAHGFVAIFALYRMTRREALPLEEQGPALAVTGVSSTVAAAATIASTVAAAATKTSAKMSSVRDGIDRELAAMSRGRPTRRR